MAPLSPAGRALHERFAAAIDDDLDLPAALAAVREIARSELPDDERRWLVLDADYVLGLDLDRVWDEPADSAPTDELASEEAALVNERSDARRRRDFARADELRDELADRGIALVDEADGTTTWRRS
jgi:cysteinyl-tRNA synthetase